MKRNLLLTCAIALAGWLAPSVFHAADSVDSRGIPVGGRAPGFTLPDQAGQEHSLSGLLQKGKFVALMFYRSADW